MEQNNGLSILDPQQAQIVDLINKLRNLGADASLKLSNKFNGGSRNLSGFYQTAVLVGEVAEALGDKFAFTQVKSVKNNGEKIVGAIRIRSPIKVNSKHLVTENFDKPTLLINCINGRMWANLSPNHPISGEVKDLFNFTEYDDGRYALFQLLLYMGISLTDKKGQYEDHEALLRIMNGEFPNSFPHFTNDVLPILTSMAHDSESITELNQGVLVPKKDHWWVAAYTMNDALQRAVIFNAKQVRVSSPSFARDETWAVIHDRKSPDVIELRSEEIYGSRIVTTLDYRQNWQLTHPKIDNSPLTLKLFQIPTDLTKQILYYTTPIHTLDQR